MDWSGRRVLVTGASSGIGRAVAVGLVRRGATVGLVARSRASLEEVDSACRGYRGAAVALPADVGAPGAVEDALVRFAGPGRLDAVVHAAGVVEIGAFEQVPPDLFDAVLRTDLGGTAATVRATLPRLRPHRGTLVVVGSMLGEVPAPLMSAYVTAKHGVHGLVHTVQAEEGRGGVRVVLVEPSAVRTPIYVKAGTRAGFRGAPIPPVVAPEKVAARILRALDRPRRTVRVGPLVRPAVALHRTLPAVYDALARQAASRLGLDREAPTGPTPGAVRTPRPDQDAVHGPPVRRDLGDVLRGGQGGRLPTAGPGTGEGMTTRPASIATPASAEPAALLTRMARAVEESSAADRVSALLAPLAAPVSATSIGDLLRDRLVGHALHPALTDLPIGAWTAASVIDLRARDAERPAATAFEGLGLLAAVPTALTGLAEWSRTTGADRRVGSAHAAVNTVALGLHAASWAARRSGRHGLGVTAGLLGNAVVGVSAFLGGHLTTVRKVGSRPPAVPPPVDAR